MKSKEQPKEHWPAIYPPQRRMMFGCKGDCYYYEDGKLVGIHRTNGRYIDLTKNEIQDKDKEIERLREENEALKVSSGKP